MAVMQSTDQQAGYTAGMQTATEHTLSHARTGDTNDQFFERPVKVAELEWRVGESLFALIDPWSGFFEDARNINRLAHFKNLRANLHVYAVVNGNPFYFGRSLMSYQPLPESDGYTFFREGFTPDLVEATQRPHVFIDPTKCEGGEIVCPFLFPKTYMDIPSREWRKMGNITVASVNALNHANGSADSIYITIFAYASEVCLYTPTSATPVLVAQADEYGILSGPSHKIANIARTLANVPTIGPYMRATEMLAKGVGAMASVFGFSRPPNLEQHANVITTSSIAVTNIADNVSTLALDAKKECTIDPRTFGLSGEDEMALVPIAKREAWVRTFPWSVDKASDSHLFSMRISPVQSVREFPETNYHITPSAFVALPFEFWKGSMNVRMQIVCSAYHRGRLRVVWDPDFSKSGDIYNTNYSALVDITESQDLSFKIGWGQNTDYLKVQDLAESVENFLFPVPFASTNPKCNGTLSVYVVNPLTTPSETTTPISVNVFTSMDDDFEVAGPRALPLNLYTLEENPIPIDPPDNPNPPPVEGDVELKRLDAGAILSMEIGQDNPDTTYPHRTNTDPGNMLMGGFVGGRGVVIPAWGPAGGDSYDLVFEFSNPQASARDVSVTIGATVVSGSLPPNIGAGLTLTVPNVTVIAGFQYINVNIEISVGAGRVQIDKITVPVLSQMSQQYVPASTVVTDNPTFTGTTGSGGFQSATGAANTSAEFALPADAYPGAPVVFPAIGGANVDGQQYIYPQSTWGYNISAIPQGGVVSLDPYSGAPGTWQPYVGGYYYLRDTLFTESFVSESDTPENRMDDKEDANAPEQEQTHQSMGPTSAVENLNEIYFGESVASWRTCLKRYDLTRVLRHEANNTNYITLSMFPLTVDDFVSDQSSLFYSNCLWRYVSSAYVCARGGMRYKYMDTTNLINYMDVQVSRVPGSEMANQSYLSNTNNLAPLIRGGWEGTSVMLDRTQRFLEWESPWYSNYRFLPARSISHYQPGEYIEPDGFVLTTHTIAGNRGVGRLYSAIAEDFTLSGFLCTPILSE